MRWHLGGGGAGGVDKEKRRGGGSNQHFALLITNENEEEQNPLLMSLAVFLPDQFLYTVALVAIGFSVVVCCQHSLVMWEIGPLL